MPPVKAPALPGASSVSRPDMRGYGVTIHTPSQIHHTVNFGNETIIWPYSTILEGTTLGHHCVIGTNVFIGRRCVIGNNVHMHPGAAIPDEARIGDRVYIGSNVTLANVAYPNLRDKTQEVRRVPVLEDDVVIGANAVILPGVIVHKGATVGAGSVVTRDVKAWSVVAGNPAHVLQHARRQAPEMNEEGVLGE